MEPRLNVITLGVENLDRSIAFYRDGLGWAAHVQGDIALFQLNGIVLALYPRTRLADDAMASSTGEGFPGFTIAYNARNETDVDRVLETAKAIGARIQKPAQRTFWGGYSGYFSDPDGFLWEIAYNPFWTLDSEGNVRL